MLVTAVVRKPRRAGRVDVYVDGEIAFDLPRETARKIELRPGRAIERDEIDAIVAAEQKRLAFEAAIAMLARRPRSEREIRRGLMRRTRSSAIVDATIDRLRTLQLIDDEAYARYWAESRDRTSPRGRRLITQELRTQGVDTTIASAATAELSDADAAYRLASRRSRALSSLDHRAFCNRMASLLQRRGFGWEVTRATVARCWAELGREAAEDDLDPGIE
jgi:regulatory protein